ncbi:MAG: LysM domain-containing protein [Planctomycetota bacterium]
MKTSAYIAIFALLVIIVVVSVLMNFSQPASPLSATTKKEETTPNERPVETPAQPPAETAHRSPGLTISPGGTDDEQETSHVNPPLPPNRDVARLPAAEGAVLARHIIDDGDTYTKLAEKYYGCSGRDTHLFAKHIERANPDKNARNLQPHSTVTIPALTPELSARLGGGNARTAPVQPATVRTSGPDLSAYRIYMAQPGDSLERIAHVKLGSTRKWKELFELNKKLGLMSDPNDLKRNQQIVLGLK